MAIRRSNRYKRLKQRDEALFVRRTMSGGDMSQGEMGGLITLVKVSD